MEFNLQSDQITILTTQTSSAQKQNEWIERLEKGLYSIFLCHGIKAQNTDWFMIHCVKYRAFIITITPMKNEQDHRAFGQRKIARGKKEYEKRKTNEHRQKKLCG